MSASFNSLCPAGLIARVTVTEALRQRLLPVLGLLAVAVVAGAGVLRELNFGESEAQFTLDLGLGGAGLFGSILAIALTSQVVASELENRTALTLLAKPVGRAEFLLGKFLGVLAVVSLYLLVVTGALFATLELQGSLSGATARTLIAGAWLLGAKFAVVAAFTLGIASYSTGQFFTVSMGLAALLVCHLQGVVRFISHQSGSWLLRGLARLVGLAFPDFEVFSLDQPSSVSSALAHATLYAAIYVALFGVLAALVFRRREL